MSSGKFTVGSNGLNGLITNTPNSNGTASGDLFIRTAPAITPGSVRLGQMNHTWPNTDGLLNQVLVTDGSGLLSFRQIETSVNLSNLRNWVFRNITGSDVISGTSYTVIGAFYFNGTETGDQISVPNSKILVTAVGLTGTPPTLNVRLVNFSSSPPTVVAIFQPTSVLVASQVGYYTLITQSINLPATPCIIEIQGQTNSGSTSFYVNQILLPQV